VRHTVRILVNSWVFLGESLRLQVMGSSGDHDGAPLELRMNAMVPVPGGVDVQEFRDLLAMLGEELIALAHAPGL
jgi:arginase family enzyme